MWTELVQKCLADQNLGSRSHRCHHLMIKCCSARDCKCYSREWDEFSTSHTCNCERPLALLSYSSVLCQRDGFVCELPKILLRRDGILMYVAILDTMLRRSGRGMLRMISSLLRNLAESRIRQKQQQQKSHSLVIARRTSRIKKRCMRESDVVYYFSFLPIAPPNQLNNLRRNMYVVLSVFRLVSHSNITKTRTPTRRTQVQHS